MNKITLGKINVDCSDLDRILDKIKKWEYNSDDYTAYSDAGGVDPDDWSTSKEEFEGSKLSFMKDIEDLINNKTLLEKELSSVRIKTNKNGSITKNRRNILLQFGCIRNYNDEYGSHSYDIDIIEVARTDNFEARLVLSSKREQSSF